MKKILLIIVAALPVMAFAQSTAGPNPPREADSLYYAFNWKDATKKYEEYVSKNAARPVTYTRLGYSYHKSGKYKEAEKNYQIAIEKNPLPGLKPFLYSRMAMTYAVENKTKEAFLWLDSAFANGYSNSDEMRDLNDYDNLRKSEKFKALYQQAYLASHPCASIPGAHLFDFWIGEWDAYVNGTNIKAGTSSIQQMAGECAILENWQSFNFPYNGKSFNWYDTTTKKWTQLWIGATGGFSYFVNGEYRDSALRFTFQQPDSKGVMQPGNFIFYNLGPNKVRQYNEISSDGGKTFQPVYDFIYIRKGTNGM